MTKKDKWDRTTKEIKDVADLFYKDEEERWKNASKQYFHPDGAPGRLSTELLDQWHREKNTGVKHPSDRPQWMVKVLLDERSYVIKNFLTEHGAEIYIDRLAMADIDAEIVKEDTFLASIQARF